MMRYKKSYVTSDESTSVPADQDDGFVGEVTVNLVDECITINTALDTSCTKTNIKTKQNLYSTWFYFSQTRSLKRRKKTLHRQDYFSGNSFQ